MSRAPSPTRRFKAIAKQLCNDETGLVEKLREKGMRVRICNNNDVLLEPFDMDKDESVTPNNRSRQMGDLIEGAFGGST